MTIETTTAYATEGSDAVFKLTRTGETTDALTVSLATIENRFDAGWLTTEERNIRCRRFRDGTAESPPTATARSRTTAR